LLELEKKREMSQPLLLVVDDEAGVRQSLQLVFNKTYRVLEATSADEAIQKLADEKPDVVLLDIVMPVQMVCHPRQMRSIHTDCQVIMLTAQHSADRLTAKAGAFIM
jgi:CheY-like chemotaxis protein